MNVDYKSKIDSEYIIQKNPIEGYVVAFRATNKPIYLIKDSDSGKFKVGNKGLSIQVRTHEDLKSAISDCKNCNVDMDKEEIRRIVTNLNQKEKDLIKPITQLTDF